MADALRRLRRFLRELRRRKVYRVAAVYAAVAFVVWQVAAIAVLPFASLMPEADAEPFADGVTEEILARERAEAGLAEADS